ncbi:MAG: YafY family protein [Bacteroidota bacterium]
MNRIDRLSAILIHLQSKRTLVAQEIADRFDISLRTVYRDIRALEEAGVPIGAEAGKGYFLMEGYALPPVSFSKEEAGAIIMAAKLADKNTDLSIQKRFEDALFKIKAALKVQEKDYLESLENNIEVVRPQPKPSDQFPNYFLVDIQNALANNLLVDFDYYSSYSDQFTNRQVEPLNLYYYSNYWHLIGYCRKRDDLRDFRTDRIMKLKVLDEKFDPTPRVDTSSYSNFGHSNAELIDAKVRFTKQVARYTTEQKYYHGFQEEEVMEDAVEMKFLVGEIDYLARWLLMYGNQVTIIYPEELRIKICQVGEEAFRHHSASERV